MHSSKSLFYGVLAVIFGSIILFYIYIFSSMVNPNIAGIDYWMLIFKKIFGSNDFDAFVAWMALALSLWGLALIVRSVIVGAKPMSPPVERGSGKDSRPKI